MRVSFLLCLVALLLGASPAAAQPGGRVTSFPFLELAPSARAAALSGAFGAVADGDVNALFYNPAVPGPATHQTAAFSYLNHLSDINAGSVAYSQTVGGGGSALHGGVRFADWGSFEGRNEIGEPTDDFGAQDVALTAGVARPLGETRLRYGGSLHLIHSRIESAQATAVAVDLGALYRMPSQRMTVAAALRNVGLSLDGYGARRPTLPIDLRLSTTKRLAHLPVLLSATAYDLTTLSEGITGGTTVDHVLAHLTFGLEARPGDVLRVRLGYNHRRSAELALTDRFDLAGFGAGFGLHVGPVAADYAYTSWSSLGGLHQFTVRADLGAW
ncbi:MAG: type IX secretion system protein PorQ [Salinibacter sp.]